MSCERRLLKHNTISFDRRLWSQVENSGKGVVGFMQQVIGRANNESGDSPDKNEQYERDANIFGKDRCRADGVMLDRHAGSKDSCQASNAAFMQVFRSTQGKP